MNVELVLMSLLGREPRSSTLNLERLHQVLFPFRVQRHVLHVTSSLFRLEFEDFEVTLDERCSILVCEKTFVESDRHLVCVTLSFFLGLVDEGSDAAVNTVK